MIRFLTAAALCAFCALASAGAPRARDLGVPFEGTAGPLNAITDVAGVGVGQVTLIEDLANGKKVRTGVTAILPRGDATLDAPVFGAWFALNGNGEMTGTAWIDESGQLEGPVMLTKTHSVGVVRDAVIAERVRSGKADPSGYWWSLPVVAETWDGELNDINGFHVRPEHAARALAEAKGGPVAEGNVGGGTGMICHEFKCGIGTASRIVKAVRQATTRWACWCRPITACAIRCASPGCRWASTCATTASTARPVRPAATPVPSSSWSPPTRPCCRTS
jgi:D-aminopeptidase